MTPEQASLAAIDHVIVCLPDLEESARVWEQEHGLSSLPGGRHTGLGTGNRIVPLGEQYIELLAVLDESEALATSFGRWAKSRVDSFPGRPAAMCLRTEHLDDIAVRNTLVISEMSRLRPDGAVLGWRMAGLEQGLALGLPFFIQWEIEPDLYPGRDAPDQTGSIDEVVLGGDQASFDDWAGPVPGVSVVPGDPGIVRVVLTTPAGSVVI
jgi:Glyoxalase-like domain